MAELADRFMAKHIDPKRKGHSTRSPKIRRLDGSARLAITAALAAPGNATRI